MTSVAHVLSGISIALLIVYGADVAVGGGEAGAGFLPLDGMTRGVGLGTPPIVLSFIAVVIARNQPSVSLGSMLVATGVLIMVGGAVSVVGMAESDNAARMAGEGGTLIGIGAVIAFLGGLQIRKAGRRG